MNNIDKILEELFSHTGYPVELFKDEVDIAKLALAEWIRGKKEVCQNTHELQMNFQCLNCIRILEVNKKLDTLITELGEK